MQLSWCGRACNKWRAEAAKAAAQATAALKLDRSVRRMQLTACGQAWNSWRVDAITAAALAAQRARWQGKVAALEARYAAENQQAADAALRALDAAETSLTQASNGRHEAEAMLQQQQVAHTEAAEAQQAKHQRTLAKQRDELSEAQQQRDQMLAEHTAAVEVAAAAQRTHEQRLAQVKHRADELSQQARVAQQAMRDLEQRLAELTATNAAAVEDLKKQHAAAIAAHSSDAKSQLAAQRARGKARLEAKVIELKERFAAENQRAADAALLALDSAETSLTQAREGRTQAEATVQQQQQAHSEAVEALEAQLAEAEAAQQVQVVRTVLRLAGPTVGLDNFGRSEQRALLDTLGAGLAHHGEPDAVILVGSLAAGSVLVEIFIQPGSSGGSVGSCLSAALAALSAEDLPDIQDALRTSAFDDDEGFSLSVVEPPHLISKNARVVAAMTAHLARVLQDDMQKLQQDVLEQVRADAGHTSRSKHSAALTCQMQLWACDTAIGKEIVKLAETTPTAHLD